MIKPLGQKIVIEKEPRGPTMIGGILIPESLERTPRFSPTVYARVLAVGSRCETLKAGDRVAVANHAGDTWLIDGRTVEMMREKDVIGKVES